jgi:polyisoprenoid-binding protein YceI
MSEGSDGAGSVAQADVATLLDGGTAAGRWVLDPAGTRVEFHVKHFWGAVTVHGSFSQITGEGTVGPDGAVTGRVSMDAASLSTRNAKRDKHLRSADFFDAEQHPQVVLTVKGARPTGQATVACQGSLEAAGHVRPIEFAARVADASADAVVLHAELMVDRTEFAMTWSPLGMASATARATVVARFVRP